MLVSVDVEDVAAHLLEQRPFAHLEHLGDLHARKGGRARAQEVGRRLAVEHEESDRRGRKPRAPGEVGHHLVEAVALELWPEVVELRQLHVGDERHDVGEPYRGQVVSKETMSFLFKNKTEMPDAPDALPGRDTRPFDVPDTHFVLGTPLEPPFPADTEQVIVGMGCFWGAEKAYWQAPGMYTTAVGYAAGHTPHPTYREVCSGRTGHNEVVLAVFWPERISFEEILRLFWEGHDPTQGMRQGNDVGSQYRSGIYVTSDAQRAAAEASRGAYAEQLTAAGYGEITTEILDSPEFFYAEDYHQQYLAKNPAGYCGIGGTGVTCPVGLAEPS